MPLLPLQTKSATENTNVPFGSVTPNLPIVFTSPNTIGSTIIVAVTVMAGTGAGGAASVGEPAIGDTQGNIYTKIFWRGGGVVLNGPAIGAWIAVNARVGSNTVNITFSLTSSNVPGTSTDFNQCVVLAEYPMPSSTSVFAATHVSRYGTYPSTVDLSLTDSASNAVTVTITTNSNTNWSWALIDLLFSSNNYLICFGMVNPDLPSINVPTVLPSGYGTFTLEEVITGVGTGLSGGAMRYWDAAELGGAPPPILPPGGRGYVFEIEKGTGRSATYIE